MERFDCHCHIFNITTVGWKAIMEQLNDALQLITDEESGDVESKKVFAKNKLKLKDKLAKLAELIKIFTQDSEKILKLLDNHYNKEYKLFPLMFDGDYLLDSYDEENLIALKSLVNNAGKKLKESNEPNSRVLKFKQQLDTIGTKDSRTVLNFLNKLSPHINSKGEKDLHKDGFTIQFEQIKKIAAMPQYKGRIFPFLGVDPRRTGIKELVKSEVGKDKLFAGIKVYPPNGFSPMDETLVGKDSIFEYCSNNGIPVISHCSYGGFATPAMNIDVNGMIIPNGSTNPQLWNGKYEFKKGLKSGFSEMVKERAEVLNHPKIWEEVLKKYPNLILVLAHFGSGNDLWQQYILSMMKKYQNLYTDVSCMSERINLMKVKAIYQTNPEVSHKFLYGSDYFLDMFFNDSFEHYIKRINSIFGIKMFERLTSENPSVYIKKWYK